MKLTIAKDVTVQIGNDEARTFSKGSVEVGDECSPAEAKLLLSSGLASEATGKTTRVSDDVARKGVNDADQ